ncbi:FRG1-like family protein [Microthyrium microscopicum]|uniref:FRG1-like family protein n=1 Tax=Microthyrium microscopicum TaxID=703497 RepID=A0A6A6TZV7_9PEZI|nr:FRG1-like family protein [Microthyrium microscopicum]
MVKPLAFKGDKKTAKKRKRPAGDSDAPTTSESKALVQQPTDQDDDSWVTAEAIVDITGPIVFVLPTEVPSALACDATGKVFALPIENMVENDPLTAEPHDVRQVWVSNRVAGSEKFSFKGHHGRYLGCNKFGVYAATREAISPEESFTCIPVADTPGTFAVQSEWQKFLTVNEDAPADKLVRGDAEEIDFNSSIRVRLQARFKPRLKVAKEERARERITRKELEDMVGRRLEEEDVKTLKRARREGNFHEKLLDVKVKGKHDKFA